MFSPPWDLMKKGDIDGIGIAVVKAGGGGHIGHGFLADKAGIAKGRYIGLSLRLAEGPKRKLDSIAFSHVITEPLDLDDLEVRKSLRFNYLINLKLIRSIFPRQNIDHIRIELDPYLVTSHEYESLKREKDEGVYFLFKDVLKLSIEFPDDSDQQKTTKKKGARLAAGSESDDANVPPELRMSGKELREYKKDALKSYLRKVGLGTLIIAVVDVILYLFGLPELKYIFETTNTYLWGTVPVGNMITSGTIAAITGVIVDRFSVLFTDNPAYRFYKLLRATTYIVLRFFQVGVFTFLVNNYVVDYYIPIGSSLSVFRPFLYMSIGLTNQVVWTLMFNFGFAQLGIWRLKKEPGADPEDVKALSRKYSFKNQFKKALDAIYFRAPTITNFQHVTQNVVATAAHEYREAVQFTGAMGFQFIRNWFSDSQDPKFPMKVFQWMYVVTMPAAFILTILITQAYIQAFAIAGISTAMFVAISFNERRKAKKELRYFLEMMNTSSQEPNDRASRFKNVVDFYNEYYRYEFRGLKAEDGTEYQGSSFKVLFDAFHALEAQYGSLNGKTLLDFGSGDLRVSVIASYVFGMRVVAAEKGIVLSDRAVPIFNHLKKVGLAENIEFFPRTDALADNFSWSDFDFLYFFFTQPKDRDPHLFLRDLQEKTLSAKPGMVATFTLYGDYQLDVDKRFELFKDRNLRKRFLNDNEFFSVLAYEVPRGARLAGKIKDKFNADFRDKIKRIIIVDEHPGLSYLVLDNKELIPALFNNFPHAEIVLHSDIASVFEAPDERRLIRPKESFLESYNRYSNEADHTLLINFLESAYG